ncbi:IS3 family transposase [Actinomadura montaniterrae]|uniref:IS3 family transposase n=1 Tax=Actinomadura montaniterrae TaxID=1803903 RepID=A0A6L3W760_9ACTN|nr:IS3 family transposase [Actinomadura montaniterrae]KAB2388828.1 IS3 family transposase [Actinomadura montaniterrae]
MDHRGAFGVQRLCRVLGLSRSGYDRWRGSALARAARVAGDARLAGRIRGVLAAWGGVYGAPRVHAELREAGTMVNRKRVERVMREHGIVGRHQRRRYRTTVPAPAAAAVPDLLRRDFSIGRADERWCGDVTYLPVAGRWMFRATVIDIGTRRVVGYSMAEHMRAELVVDALNAALRTRGGEVPGVISNSDHGGQYASAAFAGARGGRDTPVDGHGRFQRRQRPGRGVLRQPQTRDPARRRLVHHHPGPSGGLWLAGLVLRAVLMTAAEEDGR